ncbi:MAG: hypothetical protein IJJ03_10355 [Mogibacterium sp.]|nr:hypothetical protein [Mogibacterium sp.]MBQ6502144.1 hypothetical protein [Mogibacterium sp.]
MMKKTLIYLLTLLMAFSPAAVFADALEDAQDETQAPAKVEESVDVEEPDAEAPEAAEPEAPAEEAVEEEALEAAPAEEAFKEAPAAEKAPLLGDVIVNPYDPCTWVDPSTREEAEDANGKKVTGLFKASMKEGGTGLYYAENYKVVKEVGPRTVSSGWRFEYHPYDPDTGKEFWKDVTSGTYTYLINNHSGDYYAEYLEGTYWVNGKKYYVQKNGTVRVAGGVFTAKDGNTYYNTGDIIYTTTGFVTDSTTGKKYYVQNGEGVILTKQGTFTANNGKLYYAGAGGVIPAKEGLYSVGSTQYYVYADGSVKTSAGFITVNGKKYLVNSGGAISKKAGPIKYGSNWYVADSNGVICTTNGFFRAGGKIYYVTNSSGVLKVNKTVKVSGRYYHPTSNGALAIGVHKWGKYYYYSNAKGVVRTKAGIVKWNNNYYHVRKGKKGGKISTNKKVKYKGKYYIARKNGSIFTGLFTWKKAMYYASAKGVLRTKAGLFNYDGNSYYSRSGGKLYQNMLFKAGGKKYLAQSNAAIKIGYFTWQNKNYLTNDKGAIYTKTGIYTYNNTQYFVKKGGPMANYEFVTYKDNHYFVRANGAIEKKTFTYKGIKITPNSKTGIISLEDYWKVFPNEKPKEDDTTNN